MATEIAPQPDFGGREEYNQTSDERLDECQIITNAIDSLLHVSPPSYGTTGYEGTAGQSSTHIKRSFRYMEMEMDRTLDSAWPLAERLFAIAYAHITTGPLPCETYTISVNTVIHQAHISNAGTRNKYVIRYYGADRGGVTATIEQPNFTDPEQPNVTVRDTTPYDHVQLFDEIAALQNAIDAGERERAILSSLDNTPE